MTTILRCRVSLVTGNLDINRFVPPGASTDIFDAIEEIAQSLFRDAIAAHTYEDCSRQAGEVGSFYLIRCL